MMEEFKQYIISLYQDIPQEVYEGLLSVLCVGTTLFIAWKGFKTGLRYSAFLLLVEYVFLLFCSTVIFRTPGETRHYDFHPFWSYDRPELLIENIMNVVVFVPVGFLLGFRIQDSSFTIRKALLVALMGCGRKALLVALMGCGISVLIEALQFFFMRGFSEVDDVIHNTVGCLIGFCVYAIGRYGYERLSTWSIYNI